MSIKRALLQSLDKASHIRTPKEPYLPIKRALLQSLDESSHIRQPKEPYHIFSHQKSPICLPKKAYIRPSRLFS